MRSTSTSVSGFHDGELVVQERAGVAAEAARLAGMVAPAALRGGILQFLRAGRLAALSAQDADGRPWVSFLAGPAGFLDAAGPTRLVVNAAPAAGDPLHGLAAGQPVGLLVIDFATRRRVRVNGRLAVAGSDRLEIDVDQAYGNCPQYIPRRELTAVPAGVLSADRLRTDRPSDEDVALLRRADTFVVGSRHPTGGVDASHRGGPPGFLHVADDGCLWWPDYPGNNVFNTLGNLAVDPAAALIVPDFATGRAVQLSGTASVEWRRPEGGIDTGRRVHFTIGAVVSGSVLPVRVEAR